MTSPRLVSALVAILGIVAACSPPTVERQTAALTLSAESLKQRQLQLRRFDTKDEAMLLAAAAGVMQDLGFTIEETQAKVGLVSGSKDRDAVEAGQVAGQIFFVALIAALGGQADPVYDQVQKIRISVATRPSTDKAGTIARVTFQRVVWNNKAQISKLETIDDPVIYRQFFDRLSQSVFLEAHQI
jgi:hypothetical protein